MKHLVITIGCEYGAKGNAIGKKIAQDLGIKFYDRDLVDEIIKEVGIPTDIMDRVEEGGTIAGKGAQGDVTAAGQRQEPEGHRRGGEQPAAHRRGVPPGDLYRGYRRVRQRQELLGE